MKESNVMDRETLNLVTTFVLCIIVILSSSCIGTPAPIESAPTLAPTTTLPSITTLKPTQSPLPPQSELTPTQSHDAITITLNEDLDLVPGQVVYLEGTSIEILLDEAHGPPSDCYDCPNSAILIIRSAGETKELTYSISGNMLAEALEKARRLSAFDYVFVAVRIDENIFTLRVESDLP
ncbi:MAG: hypothetical protein GTO18_21710 [Anaerolineales bacterium]|nr:hypothetical protein [Anaerolineales bacterium]